MEIQAFTPALNFTAAAQPAHGQQSTLTITTASDFKPSAIQTSPWSLKNVGSEADLALQISPNPDRDCKFAAESQFSDLNSAQSPTLSTDVSTSSDASSPSNSHTVATQQAFVPTQTPQSASGNPFMAQSKEFAPSGNFSAPAFVPSAPTFQPTHLQSFAAPSHSAPYYNQQGFYGAQPCYQQDFYYNQQYLMGGQMTFTCDPDGKYKTELCKNWIETAKCRYQDKCRFAHGQEELTVAAMRGYNQKFKSKNCRTFYHTKQCMYGTRCMFRHEHRNFGQLHRHYYTPQLFVLETLFASAPSKRAFIERYEPTTSSLPIFAQIHSDFDAEQAALAQQESEGSEAELSEIEMSAEMITQANQYCVIEKTACNNSNSCSFLNTTQDSANDELPPKFALNLCSGPARIQFAGSDEDLGADSSNEDLDVSPRSLGLDFV